METKFRKKIRVFVILCALLSYQNAGVVLAVTNSSSEIVTASNSSESTPSSSDSKAATNSETSSSSSDSKAATNSETSPSSSYLEASNTEFSIKVGLEQAISSEKYSIKVNQQKPTNTNETKTYNETVEKINNRLQSSELQVNALQIFNVSFFDHSGNEQDNLSSTDIKMSFKETLRLRGIDTNKKNIQISTIDKHGIINDSTPTVTFNDDGEILSASFESKSNKSIIIYTTIKKQNKNTIKLGNYGTLDIDKSAFQADDEKYSPDYSKRVEVRLHIAKLNDYEDVSEDKLYKNKEVISYISTWDNTINISSVNLSSNHLVMRSYYKQAHTEQSDQRIFPEGEYEVTPYTNIAGNTSQGVIDLYIMEIPSVKQVLSRVNRVIRSIPSGAITTVPEDKTLPHKKNIDYLGDGVDNPDTSVDNPGSSHDSSDLSRMYLDLKGIDKPIDFLIMVDKSKSMSKGISNDVYSPARDQVLTDILNGTANSEGMTKRILNLNPDNKLALAEFHGYGYPQDWQRQFPNASTKNISVYDSQSSSPSTSKNRDSTVIKDWGRDASEIPFANRSTTYPNRFLDLQAELAGNSYFSHGTNYSAAYATAANLFKSSKVVNDGSKKVLIFISDGVPTFWYSGSTEGSLRYGNGVAATIGSGLTNVINAKSNTIRRFNEFFQSNPDVSTYSIGVSSDINSVAAHSNPEVLKYMSSKSGGNYYKAESSSELYENFKKIIDSTKATEASITDELSQYVNWYSAQPDAKVTRINKATGEVETLYVNGTITSKGKGILDPILPITYTSSTSNSSTGKVAVKFANGYYLDKSWMYTLSFNVEVNDKAYLDYKNGGGSYNQTGDKDTDYKNNDTSSNKVGFRSNNDAYAVYTIGGQTYAVDYDYPVIQVKTSNFKLVKVDAENNNKALSGVKFELRLEDKKTVWTSPISNSSGVLDLNYLRRGKTYYLYETKTVDGYQLVEQPWKIVVNSDGTSIAVYDQNNKELTTKLSGNTSISNKKLYQLPSTGGPGTIINIVFGTGITTTILLIYFNNRKNQLLK